MSQIPPPQPPWKATSSPGASTATEPIMESPADRPPPSRWRWLVLLIPILLVACPVLIGELPHEIAMWHGATALERQADGDLDGALDSLRRGLDWQPDNVPLLAQRSEWLLERGDLEGSLADAQTAVERHGDEATPYMQRATVLQRLGRHQEAVDDWNRLVELAGDGTHVVVRFLDGTRQVDVYNGRAYARAVGNLDLEQGLADVNQSIKQLGENVAVLDTRGFLYYHLGDYELARVDLDKAVAQADAYYDEVARSFDEVGPPSDENKPKVKPESKPGDKPESKPKAKPEVAPDQPEQVPLRSRFLDARELEQFRHEVAELVAVIRYHRSLVLDKLDEPELAGADRDRVIELGFQPEPDLY